MEGLLRVYGGSIKDLYRRPISRSDRGPNDVSMLFKVSMKYVISRLKQAWKKE